MIALLLAAQITAAATIPSAPPPAKVLPTPNLYREPARCKDAATKVVDRYGRPVTQKLGDLPPGALQYAVDRSIDGCRVITVIFGNVLPDQPDVAGQGRMMPLIKAPAVREGAPSNRR